MKKSSINFKDIIERAKQKKEKKPFDKIQTRHLNTKNRAASKFEQTTNF